MTSDRTFRPPARIAAAALVAAAAAAPGWLGAGAPREARAEDSARAAPAAAAPAAAPVACSLRGSQAVPKGTPIHDTETGGRVIATFTGAIAPLQIESIPADPSSGRARVRTSLGEGLRLEGFVPASALSPYVARDVPVVPSRVWIASGHRVKLAGASAGALTAEIVVAGSQGQVVRATAPCDAFTLDPPSPKPMDVPGNARGYTMRSATMDLFDAPNGTPVFSLRMTEHAGQLFWGTRPQAGFVHVQSRADIAIDAWARLADLTALPKGEMMDQLAPPTRAISGVQLAFDKTPTVVKATKVLAVRARRDEKEKPIGQVEVGAEIYLIETFAGWTNVLPKHLAFVPPPEGGFWIPSSEVPR